MPRQYVCNLIYSLLGDSFKKWVLENCTESNKAFQTKHKLEIKLQARVAEALMASTAVNQTKGTGAHLMK